MDELRIQQVGEAIVLYTMECMYDAAVELGLPAWMARLIIAQTVYGTGKYALVYEKEFAELRKEVTSPGGTTEAALNVLLEDNIMGRLVNAAFAAADILTP